VNAVLAAVAGLASALTIAGFLGRWGWMWELASHFRAQYAAALTFCAALLFLRQQPVWAAAAGAGALLNFATFLPWYLSAASGPSTPNGKPIRALLLNLDHHNRAADRVISLVRMVDPDLILFIEVTRRWKTRLSALEQAYPFRVGLARPRGWGMLLLSRLPLECSQVLDRRRSGIPGVVAGVSVGRRRLTLIGAHPFAPVSRRYAASRNRQLAALARLAAAQERPVVVLGDLNITPWSPYFHQLLRAGGLRDSRCGFGVQPTWPAWCWPLRIPIDHCLVSPGVAVHRRQIGPRVGSDHYPVIMEFSTDARYNGG